MEMLIVSLASLLAGFVDSIVGGGGLVLVPALFATFPNAHPATLFGTNKGASVWGTGMATWQYSRRVSLPWPALLPAALVAMLASLAGAWLVTVVSPDFLRKLLPAILLLVLGLHPGQKGTGAPPCAPIYRPDGSGPGLLYWCRHWFLRWLFRPRHRQLFCLLPGALSGL